MTHDDLRGQARDYYEAKLRQHGPIAAGVDWNSERSQELRFRQFERLWGDDRDAAIVDYGCGYGALASYLRAGGHRGPYIGFDVSGAMIEAARQHTAALPSCRFTSRRSDVVPADYVVASGVLNVKQGAAQGEWHAYVADTIDDLARLGSRGFGFNALTNYAESQKRRTDLYYADPLQWFEHCARAYSRSVALLQDYPLWEFTVLVRQKAV
jgi:SAM-dependent methyltransferase